MDDLAFDIIGTTCPNLLEVNAARTYITNDGVRSLSVEEDQITPR